MRRAVGRASAATIQPGLGCGSDGKARISGTPRARMTRSSTSDRRCAQPQWVDGGDASIRDGSGEGFVGWTATLEGLPGVTVHRRIPVEAIDPIGVLQPGDNGEWTMELANHGPNVIHRRRPDPEIERPPKAADDTCR